MDFSTMNTMQTSMSIAQCQYPAAVSGDTSTMTLFDLRTGAVSKGFNSATDAVLFVCLYNEQNPSGGVDVKLGFKANPQELAGYQTPIYCVKTNIPQGTDIVTYVKTAQLEALKNLKAVIMSSSQQSAQQSAPAVQQPGMAVPPTSAFGFAGSTNQTPAFSGMMGTPGASFAPFNAAHPAVPQMSMPAPIGGAPTAPASNSFFSIPAAPESNQMPGMPPMGGQMSGMPPMGGQMSGMPPMGGAPGQMPGQIPGMPPMSGAPGQMPGQIPGMPPMGGQMPGMPPMGGQMPGMPPMGGQMPGMPPMGGQMPGQIPGMPPMSGAPGQIPGMPPMSGAPGQIPGMPPMSGAPGQIPGMPPMSGAPGQIPGMPPMSGAPGQIPGMPPMSGMNPSMGGIPGVGMNPSLSGIPSGQFLGITKEESDNKTMLIKLYSNNTGDGNKVREIISEIMRKIRTTEGGNILYNKSPKSLPNLQQATGKRYGFSAFPQSLDQIEAVMRSSGNMYNLGCMTAMLKKNASAYGCSSLNVLDYIKAFFTLVIEYFGTDNQLSVEMINNLAPPLQMYSFSGGMPGQMPGMPGQMPPMGGMPGQMPGMPGQMPPMGGMPGQMPPMGGMPGMPPMGGMPGMPPMGGMPGMPPMGGMPGMPPMGGMPGQMPPMGGMPGQMAPMAPMAPIGQPSSVGIPMTAHPFPQQSQAVVSKSIYDYEADIKKLGHFEETMKDLEALVVDFSDGDTFQVGVKFPVTHLATCRSNHKRNGGKQMCLFENVNSKDELVQLMKIRCYGIDAAEFHIKVKGGPMQTTREGWFAQLLMMKFFTHIASQRADLRVDLFGHDVYGRVLGDFKLNGVSVNQELLKVRYNEAPVACVFTDVTHASTFSDNLQKFPFKQLTEDPSEIQAMNAAVEAVLPVFIQAFGDYTKGGVDSLTAGVAAMSVSQPPANPLAIGGMNLPDPNAIPQAPGFFNPQAPSATPAPSVIANPLSQFNQMAAPPAMSGMPNMGQMPSMPPMNAPSQMSGMPPMGQMPSMGGMPPMGGMPSMPPMGSGGYDMSQYNSSSSAPLSFGNDDDDDA